LADPPFPTRRSSDLYEGYEPGFQKTANFAALFYFLLGLGAISKLLRSFYFRNGTIAAVIALMALGTNLLFYTANAPAFSHVYSLDRKSTRLNSSHVK